MTEPTKRYAVLSVHVENFERIEVVDVQPGPDLTIISSVDNRMGKTSFLDFLRAVFEGKEGRSTVPIRQGHSTGGGFVVLGSDGTPEFTIELELREGKADRLTIRDAEGKPTAHGATWLKSLTGRGIAFDPSEFDSPPGAKTVEARDKIRLDMISRIFPLSIDLKLVAEQRKSFYEQRTQANRDVDSVGAELRALGAKKAVPDAVDLAAKTEARRAASATQNALAADNATVKRLDDAMATLREDMARIKAQYEKLTADRKAIVEKWAASALPDAEALLKLDAEIADGQRTNVERERVIAGNAQYDKLLAKFGAAKKLAEGLGASIEKLDAEKAAAIAAVKYPIEHLETTESEVRYRGLPYESGSDAERLEVAFAICACDKPTLSLALIDVGERFSPAAVERVRVLAQRFGVQVILARRSPDIANRVELVDGRVAAVVGS